MIWSAAGADYAVSSAGVATSLRVDGRGGGQGHGAFGQVEAFADLPFVVGFGEDCTGQDLGRDPAGVTAVVRPGGFGLGGLPGSSRHSPLMRHRL